ncbi:capsular polysaccharide biosynthesis protein [Salinisphaera shabanensis T35B1]|uniref:O-antigen ligase family protein n=1 Tax=Salinisphaera shabanensis TaxID=180542 RepID=UPI003340F980
MALPADNDTRFSWLLVAVFWATLAFALLPDGLDWARDTTLENAQQGSLIRRLQWMSPFIVCALIVWLRRGVAWRVVRHVDPFLLLFVGWAILSLGWSDYPDVTVRKLVLLIGTLLIALAFQVAAWRPARLRQHTRACLTAVVVASIVAVFMIPHIARVAGYDNAWTGITRSKNHLGMAAGLMMVLWMHGFAIGEVRALPALAWTALAALTLIMARNATALLCVVALLPPLWLFFRPVVSLRGLFLRSMLALAAVIVSICFVVLVTYGVPGWRDIVSPVANAVGRDVTFTGRLEIWRLVYAEVVKHPWLGTGFQAFWLGAGGPAPWVTQDLYGGLWQAHNGYLDVVNELGIPGLLLALGFWANTIRRGVTLLPAWRAEAAWVLAFMVFLAIANIAESSFFRPIHFMFLLSIHASLALARLRAIDPSGESQ